jgi:23S rRNA (uracil1939-C5)-methyltransferase
MKHQRLKSTQIACGRTELVQIEKPIYGGSFLARVEGKATFVPLSLPGEEARVRITEEKRSYASAEVEEIVTPAANRIAPGCPHFGVCGGCHYQHTDYESQLRFKEAILRETLSRGKVAAPERIELLAGNPWHYRNRIRLAFDHAGRVGYRARRSHSLVPIGACPIAAPLLADSALIAAELLRSGQFELKPSEISLFSNADQTELLITLFRQSTAKQTISRFAERLKARIPATTGVQLVATDRPDQPESAIATWGNSSLTYRAGGIDYSVSHGAFFQVNRWLIDKFVSHVTEDQQGRLAWDLFAGVGLFARRLAVHFADVIAVESAFASRQTLSRNLEGTTGRSITADVLAFLKRKESKAKPDLIVIDPPRAGLGEEVIRLLGATGAQALVYVSCDAATLARDLHIFAGAGYAVSSVTLADLFPQTFHLETVVKLQRA